MRHLLRHFIHASSVATKYEVIEPVAVCRIMILYRPGWFQSKCSWDCV